MFIHREGFKTLSGIVIILFFMNLLIWMSGARIVLWISISLSLLIIAFVTWFFRVPSRPVPEEVHKVVAPADGTILSVDELFVGEFFGDYRTRVSIFMSGGNVHINWVPLTGYIRYQKYNPGTHLVAKHPKSSDRNERCSVVIENRAGNQIMVRQIAGVMARRVITYPKPGNEVRQGGELGFIKFGSRVDLFLPTGTEILVKPGDKTIGRVTQIAEMG